MLVRAGVKHQMHPRIPGLPRRTADFRVGDIFIFMHGRFWHDPKGPTEQMNLFWRSKVRNNRKRDLSTYRHLYAAEYGVIELWDDRPHLWPRAVWYAATLKRAAGRVSLRRRVPSSVAVQTSRTRSRPSAP